MEIMKEKIGTVVTNDGKGLSIALELTELRHTGNFNFEGKHNGTTINIATEPTDEDGDFIRITGIRVNAK